MNVLISWSKEQSQELAACLKEWLPVVLPGVRPWMSAQDIEMGSEWFNELKAELRTANHCIICITPENIQSPWLYYEAGSVSRNGDGILICPYLLGVSPASLANNPLSQFQCASAGENDTLQLILALNRSSHNPTPHSEELLRGNFKLHWPKFEERLRGLLENLRDRIVPDAGLIPISHPEVQVLEPSGTVEYLVRKLKQLASDSRSQWERYRKDGRNSEGQAYLKRLAAEIDKLCVDHAACMSATLQAACRQFVLDLNSTASSIFSSAEQVFAAGEKRCEDFDDLNRQIEIFSRSV